MKTYNAPYTQLVTLQGTTIICISDPNPAPGNIQGTPGGGLNQPIGKNAPIRYLN